MTFLDIAKVRPTVTQFLRDRIPNRQTLLLSWPFIAVNIFWFLVLVSWLPMIAGLQDILVRLRLGTAPDAFSVRPDTVSFVLVAVGILATGLVRFRFIPVLCVLPALMAVLLGIGPANLGNWSELAPWLLPIGLGLVALSGLCFVLHGRIRSPAVAAFLLLAGIEALSGIFPLAPSLEEGASAIPPVAPQPGAPTPAVFLTFGRLFHAYHLSVLDLLIVASLIVLGRFLVLVWRHNQPGWVGLRENADLRTTAVRTAWLSVPFFVLIGVLGWFWNGVGREAEAYAITVLATPGPTAAKSLEDALRQASAREQQKVAERSKASLGDATAKAKDGTTQLVGSVMPNVRASFPAYLMELRGCRWYDVFCHVMNGIKSVVNSVYRKARDAALNSLEAELRRADAYGKDQLDTKRRIATEAVDSFSRQTTRWADTAVSKAFETASWIGLILSIYGFIVAVKTVMVIMSRLLYRDTPDNPLFASLKPNTKNPVSHLPTVVGNEAVIPYRPPGSPDTYIALRYEIRNAVANVSLPQPGTGIFGRMLSGRYVLGLLRTSSLPKEGASIVVNAPSELVTWSLAPGEEIILRYDDLVAFSSTVRLAIEINFSLQATLFGRFLFHKAIGPGDVIMQTQGEAVAGHEKDAAESRRATSLKAWELQAGFQIQSNLDWRGVYLAPYNIRKQARSLLIYDNGPENSRWSSLGLIKAVRTFLLPF
ncbi:hypothetical protein B6S44_06955 [Bosea sp. Tri-44]|uniref:AIM24 family protein n=1 Tax=Bosea sp. Tri-44 TaxID=1972137 RepID=UPI00100F0181|nr:AIM24 family protein [Bosea sp. Tri-44]RXT55828.1 hypothetical protein B6S44_06955 [Bosea sp. Tri-44]